MEGPHAGFADVTDAFAWMSMLQGTFNPSVAIPCFVTQSSYHGCVTDRLRDIQQVAGGESVARDEEACETRGPHECSSESAPAAGSSDLVSDAVVITREPSIESSPMQEQQRDGNEEVSATMIEQVSLDVSTLMLQQGNDFMHMDKTPSHSSPSHVF